MTTKPDYLLIVEDDPDILKLLDTTLRFRSYRVITARNAAASVGLPIEGLMIIGHPYETWESAMRTVDFSV